MEPQMVYIRHSEWIEPGTCGPACAQMLLRASAAAIKSKQASLYCEECHTVGSKWDTDPDGLSRTLIKKDGASQEFYQPVKGGSEETLSRHMCWMLQSSRAPIALINGERHWVVVCGCKTDISPTSSSDRNYSIEYIYINDPAMKTKVNSSALQMYEEVPYRIWSGKRFRSGVSSDESEAIAYAGKWVAIGAIIPPGEVRVLFPPTATPGPIATPNPIVDEERAIEIARQVLDQPSVEKDTSWNQLINRDLVQMTPVPVIKWRDLRNPEDLTYLIPFRDAGTSEECPDVPVIVQIGETGDYRGLVTVPGGSIYLGDDPGILDADLTKSRFDNQFFVDDQGQEYQPSNAEEGWANELYWTPSTVSLTPYMPFYILNFNGGEVQVYLRLDGKYFFELGEDIYGW